MPAEFAIGPTPRKLKRRKPAAAAPTGEQTADRAAKRATRKLAPRPPPGEQTADRAAKRANSSRDVGTAIASVSEKLASKYGSKADAAAATKHRRAREAKPTPRAKAPAAKRPAAPRMLAGGARSPLTQGVGRALGHEAAATVTAFARNPYDQSYKTVRGAAQAVAGTAAAAAAAVKSAKELATTGRSPTAKAFAKGAADSYSERLGPSFRGEKGALTKLTEHQIKEGSFEAIADISTVAAPLVGGAASTVTKVAAGQAKAGRVGTLSQKAAKVIDEPAPIKRDMRPAEARRPARTVTGAGARAGADAVRRKVQKRAVRSGKPLSPRRAALKPGEVTPVLSRRPNSQLRRRTAETETREVRRAELRRAREVTGKKGPRDVKGAGTTRTQLGKLSSAKAQAVALSVEFGVRGSVAAKPVIRKRIADLEKARRDKPLADHETEADELPALRALLEDASPFDDAAVRTAADAETTRGDRLGGPDMGIEPDRHKASVFERQAQIAGVERREAESVSEYAERVAADLGVERTKGETHAAFNRRLDQESKAAARRTGRAAELPLREGETPAEHKVRLAAAFGITRHGDEPEAAFRRRLVAAKADAPKMEPRRKGETADEFVERVRAERAPELVDPGYLPSRKDAQGDAAVSRIGTPPAGARPLASRKGDVYERGLERREPRMLEEAHTATLRSAARTRAEAEIITREGTRLRSPEAANAWIRERNLDPKQVRVLESPTLRQGDDKALEDRGDFIVAAGTWVVPTTAVDELVNLRKPLNPAARQARRAVRLSSAILLGHNPGWLGFQVVSDLSTAAAAGGLGRSVQNSKAYRALDDKSRETIDVLTGDGAANDIADPLDGEQLGRMASIVDSSPAFSFVRDNNPFTAALKANRALAAEMRRSVFITRLLKDARTQNMDKNLRGLRRAETYLHDVFRRQDPAEIESALGVDGAAERAAVHLNNMLGDYSTYTHAERTFAQPTLMFYGYTRYSLRLLTHVLPKEHPLLLLALAQIGNQGAEQARKFIGSEAVYGYGNLFTHDGQEAIDLSRANPAANALVGLTGTNQLVGLLSPPVQTFLNYAVGRDVMRDRGVKVRGEASPTSPDNLTSGDKQRIAARTLLNASPVFRTLEKLQDDPQSDDTLPFARRPIAPLDVGTAVDYEDSAARRELEGSKNKRAAVALLPLIDPERPTELPEIADSRLEREAEFNKGRAAQAAKRDGLATPIGRARFDVEKRKERLKRRIPSTDTPTLEAARNPLRAIGIEPNF